MKDLLLGCSKNCARTEKQSTDCHFLTNEIHHRGVLRLFSQSRCEKTTCGSLTDGEVRPHDTLIDGVPYPFRLFTEVVVSHAQPQTEITPWASITDK